MNQQSSGRQRRTIHITTHPGRVVRNYLVEHGTATKKELLNEVKERSGVKNFQRGCNEAIKILIKLEMVSVCEKSGKIKWLGNPHTGNHSSTK